MIGELILTLFHARTNAHVLHLSTRSFAAHVALQEFYDGLIPLTDRLAEAYQGEYGLITFGVSAYRPYGDALALLDALREKIDACARKEFSEDDTHLNNVADELRALIASTQYKLRFLK